MEEDELVLIENVNINVARVVLNHPPLNFISRKLAERLGEILDEIEHNSSIRAVIVTGAGDRVFSAGSDIKEFSTIRNAVVEEKLLRENTIFNRIANLPIPTIAAVRFSAFGGGCELALACDLRVLSEDAKIGLPEIKLGWFPSSGGLYRLPYLVGPAVAKELMMFGETISANDALRLGLVNRVVPPEQVHKVSEDMALTLAQRPKQAVQAIKKGVSQCFEWHMEDLLLLNLELSRDVFAGEDAEEGIHAFFEKRRPVFKHR